MFSSDSMPSDPEAEKGVLSCFLHQPHLLHEAAVAVLDDYFYHPGNRTLYAAFKEQYASGRPVEYIALTSYLRDANLLEMVGGPGVLSEILGFIPAPEHYRHYCVILRDKYVLRRTIGACTTSIEEAYSYNESVPAFCELVRDRVAEAARVENSASSACGKSILDLQNHKPDPNENLLGHGWLRRGGAAIFVGPSGIGKSSASMMQDVAWAAGRSAFGIEPARPLRILTIQSENDLDDLHEMARGVLEHVRLNADETTLMHANTRYVAWTAERGDSFLRKLRAVVRDFQPDLIRIDPLQGFAGCKIEDSEQIGNFLRAGLNTILVEYRCGLIICHHTPKPRQEQRTDRTALDFAYAGAGGAEITNWARAILAIEVKGDDTFAFHAAKRGRRIGWEDATGYHEVTRYFRHAREPGALHWEEITDEGEKRAVATSVRGKKDPKAAIMAEIPVTTGIEKRALIACVAQQSGIGVNRIQNTLKMMLDADAPEIVEVKEPRPGTRPPLKIRRLNRSHSLAA
jgi:hypothetical protein